MRDTETCFGQRGLLIRFEVKHSSGVIRQSALKLNIVMIVCALADYGVLASGAADATDNVGPLTWEMIPTTLF